MSRLHILCALLLAVYVHTTAAGILFLDRKDGSLSTVQPMGLDLNPRNIPDLPADDTFTLPIDTGLPANRSKFFRYTFDLPQGYTNLSFLLEVGVNDEFAVYLNDERVAVQSDTALANFEEPLPGFLLSPDNTAVDTSGFKMNVLSIDQSLLREGVNELTILAVDTLAGGAFFDMNGVVTFSTPPADLEGAATSCGFEDEPTRQQSDDVISCSAFDGAIRAQADLPNAEVKVFAADSGKDDDTEATALLVDLITVTEGFGAGAEVSGTYEVDISGMIDTGSINHEGEARFLATLWYPDQPAPPCVTNVDDCLLEDSIYDFAEVEFDLFANELDIDTRNGGLGSASVTSTIGSDLRAILSIPWTVDEETPAFYVALFGLAEMDSNAPGTTDFFNTAKAVLRGPDGFQYAGKNAFGRNFDGAQPVNTRVDLTGEVATPRGTEICALVLASGRFKFSCTPRGPFDLLDLPREADGTVIRQIYANGFFPGVEVLRGSVHESVALRSTGPCPNYNAVPQPVSDPAAAGRQHSISGRVLLQDSQEPLCALVLANGQFMFSCNDTGSYQLNLPLDSNGLYTLQVYASGFAPAIQTFDASSAGGDVRMARASECN